jgi:hypothetical protein
MRGLVLAAVASVVLVGAAAAEPAAYEQGAFPRDEVSLRALDDAQIRIVRRATVMCWHSSPGIRVGAAIRGCIIGTTESAIANTHDPVLIAFHQALPFFPRYDENRPAYYWQRMAMK